MLRKNRLFTPGPTPLLPAAQFAGAAFTAHHRTADFRALYTRVLADMKEFVGTQNDVLVLACSGTGVMEASISNLTSPGDKILVLTAGKFGERWTGLGKAFGCNVETFSKPYGQTFALDEVRAKLIQAALEDAGIPAQIVGEVTDNLYHLGWSSGPRLHVSAADADRALAILRDREANA